MALFVGLDVSLKMTSICIVEADGSVVWEAAREPAEPFRIGDATIDPRTFQLKRGRTSEELTARELKLLQLFHAHPGDSTDQRPVAIRALRLDPMR